jgi:hypothetical protein
VRGLLTWKGAGSREHFGLSSEDLNIDLEPLGTLLAARTEADHARAPRLRRLRTLFRAGSVEPAAEGASDQPGAYSPGQRAYPAFEPVRREPRRDPGGEADR